MNELEQFESIMQEIVELKKKKMQDYGNSWKIFGLLGLIYQIMSKAIRIWNLRSKDPKNESLEDSFRDLVVYCVMAIQLIRNNETEPKI